MTTWVVGTVEGSIIWNRTGGGGMMMGCERFGWIFFNSYSSISSLADNAQNQKGRSRKWYQVRETERHMSMAFTHLRDGKSLAAAIKAVPGLSMS